MALEEGRPWTRTPETEEPSCQETTAGCDTKEERTEAAARREESFVSWAEYGQSGVLA